jgi:hypothetical protein
MEPLSFGQEEAKAVAKLIAAGPASEKVEYMKSPRGLDMNELLTPENNKSQKGQYRTNNAQALQKVFNT